MTTDTNNPAPIAEYACTWRTPDRTGMRYPEQSDLSGGATDRAPAVRAAGPNWRSLAKEPFPGCKTPAGWLPRERLPWLVR